MTRFILTLLLVTSPILTFALDTPAPSPRIETTQRIGLTDFTLDYSRPSIKDREIFGGLVPYDEVWRTGANASTKISFNQDIIMGGEAVKAGTYGLYTIPGEEEWTVILSNDSELWGAGGYTEENDALRVTIKPDNSRDIMESMLIYFDHLRNDSAHLVIHWDSAYVAVPIDLHTKDQVQANIDKASANMDAWKAGDFANAARTYHDYDLDREQALKWINTAIESNDKAFYWVHTKALILAELGRDSEAIEAAEKSLEMATAAEGGDFGYIDRNKELLNKLR